MDFVELASNATTLAFTIAGDAKTTATLHLGKERSHDFVTDADTETGGQDVEISGIFYRSRQVQNEEDRANSAIFMVQGADIPSVGIDESDTLTIDGIIWNPYSIERVPTEAIVLIFIRK